MPMVKRKPKRRPQHRPVYCRKELSKNPDRATVLSLMSEAAKQPKRLISDDEYTELYWQAIHLLKKGEC